MTPTDTNIVIDTTRPTLIWCVYEHQCVLEPEKPPETILVGACRLTDCYKLIDGKTNSEWGRIYANGGAVLVRIIQLHDDALTAKRAAIAHIKTLPHPPRCNLRGVSMRGAKRPIICDQNGQEYATQGEAAEALGISQSGISRHMAGELAHVQGHTFHYRAV